MVDNPSFTALTDELAHGLLRQALGYRIERKIPYYRGIVGYVVTVPMLWIRHSHFPILFIAYRPEQPNILDDIVTQLQHAQTSEYFAVLVVIPTEENNQDETEELRRIIANSVYRYDFVVLNRDLLASIIAQNNTERLVEIILEQNFPLSSLSPYVTKGPVPEEMFFGREEEIKTISQSIQRSDYAIVGGRRIGKSSILFRLRRHLDYDKRYFAIYHNCEDKVSDSDFVKGLADTLTLTDNADNPTTVRALVSETRQAHPSEQIVFLLDEVDALLAFDANHHGHIFKSLRALSQENACHFVFSGSKTLYQHLHNPKSPFFNFCEEIALKPLSPTSVEEIVTKPMQQLGIALPAGGEVTDRIVDVTSCHPNLVQWICDQLLQTVTAQQKQITERDLEALLHSREFGAYFIETAWGDATPLEKIVSLLIDPPTSSFSLSEVLEAAAHCGIVNQMAIRDALTTLELYALLERWGKQYRFVLRQFPDIVREFEDVPLLIEGLITQLEV